MRKFFCMISHERHSFIVFYILGRLIDRLIGRTKATLLGWPNSYLGYGAKISGSKAIMIAGNAYVNRYAWIEAVHQFGGQTFQPVILIGRGLAVADRLHISSINRIEIGDNCLFGSGVYISDHNHGSYKMCDQSLPTEPPVKRKLVSFGPVIIGSNVWLGDNVIIAGSVKIGNGVVVGANSVVTKDIPDNVIVAGAPLKMLKTFNQHSGLWERVVLEEL